MAAKPFSGQLVKAAILMLVCRYHVAHGTTSLPARASSSFDVTLLDEAGVSTPGGDPRGAGRGDTGLPPRVALMHAAADGLYKYGMTSLFILGTIGNVLALAVLIRRMRSAPGTPYLIALGFIDQYNIFSAVLASHVVRSFTGFDYIRFHRAACKFAYFSIVACAQASFYLVAAMSLERALVVSRPLRFLNTFTTRRTTLIILAILTVWVGKNLNLIWTQGAVYVPDHNGTGVLVSECGIARGDTYFFGTQVRPWLDYAITLLAALVILLCNAVIIAFVCKSVRMHRRTANVKATETERKVMQLIPMLITTSLTFLILAMPLQVVTIVFPSNPNDLEGAALSRVLWAFGLLTNYMNNGVNFYLYCLSGSTFRRELMHMLRCHRNGPRGSKSNGSLSNGDISHSSAITTVSRVMDNTKV